MCDGASASGRMQAYRENYKYEKEGVSHTMLNMLKKALVTIMTCLCLTLAAVPAVETCAAVQTQTETQAAQEGQAAAQTSDDESAFFLLFMGGGLLIILFAVISAMSTVSGAISVAVNMDVDGE